MDKFEEIKNKIDYREIKSSYIIDIIISFLPGKLPLNLIKFNKELQKKYSVDINNYKQASGKYKIGGKNGKGKEYRMDKNILLFEGEYLNGKRNGKGKEYNYYGQLIYEGEYFFFKKIFSIK